MKNIKIKIFAVILTLVAFTGFKTSQKAKISKAPLLISKSVITHSSKNSCSARIEKMLNIFKNKKNVCKVLKKHILMMTSLQTKMILTITRSNVNLASQNKYLKMQIKYLKKQIKRTNRSKIK